MSAEAPSTPTRGAAYPASGDREAADAASTTPHPTGAAHPRAKATPPSAPAEPTPHLHITPTDHAASTPAGAHTTARSTHTSTTTQQTRSVRAGSAQPAAPLQTRSTAAAATTTRVSVEARAAASAAKGATPPPERPPTAVVRDAEVKAADGDRPAVKASDRATATTTPAANRKVTEPGWLQERFPAAWARYLWGDAAQKAETFKKIEEGLDEMEKVVMAPVEAPVEAPAKAPAKPIDFHGPYNPENDDIFNAFKYCPPEKTKAVFLLIDPVQYIGGADGLALSAAGSLKYNEVGPTIKDMVYALEEDKKSNFSNPYKMLPNLQCWAEQGVLLLNRYLTVPIKTGKDSTSCGHKAIWKGFIDGVLTTLVEKKQKEKKRVAFVILSAENHDLLEKLKATANPFFVGGLKACVGEKQWSPETHTYKPSWFWYTDERHFKNWSALVSRLHTLLRLRIRPSKKVVEEAKMNDAQRQKESEEIAFKEGVKRYLTALEERYPWVLLPKEVSSANEWVDRLLEVDKDDMKRAKYDVSLGPHNALRFVEECKRNEYKDLRKKVKRSGKQFLIIEGSLHPVSEKCWPAPHCFSLINTFLKSGGEEEIDWNFRHSNYTTSS